MTLGITLIIIGVLAIIVGIIIINQKETPLAETHKIINGPTPTQQEKPHKDTQSDLQKGHDFEGYVIQKFAKKYFTLADWRSDKSVNGMYPESNSNPDFTMRFQWHDVNTTFAVECKYRSDYYKNGVEWCTERQLEKYRKYESNKNQKVFIIIGIGGEASDPSELFIIPLNKIAGTFLGKDFLNKYKKEHFKEANMYFDTHTEVLR